MREWIYFSIKVEGIYLLVVVVLIIVRYLFLMEMDKLLCEVGMIFLKGVGLYVDEVVVKLIFKKGVFVFRIFIKFYFVNI